MPIWLLKFLAINAVSISYFYRKDLDAAFVANKSGDLKPFLAVLKSASGKASHAFKLTEY
jgi:hypothetical protein